MTVTINGTTGIDAVQPGTVQQADLAANVVGNGPCFSAYKSGANQTVVSGTPTLVTFQTEVFDVGGYFNLGTGRFTPLVAGYYQVSASVYGSASPISTVAGAIYRNGVSVAQVSVNGTIAILPITALVYMNGTTDYLELFGTITGTTPVIGFGLQGSTSFSAVLVGAA